MHALLSYLASQLEAHRERFAASGALIHEDARTMGKTIADQFREQGLRLGKAVGKTEGKHDGRLGRLRHQLRLRFDNVPPSAEQARRTRMNQELDRRAERILSAAAPSERLS